MENDKKMPTDAEKLRDFMHSVPYGKYNNVRRRMVEACLVPVTTFNNWVFGRCRIPELAKREINTITVEITGREIF